MLVTFTNLRVHSLTPYPTTVSRFSIPFMETPQPPSSSVTVSRRVAPPCWSKEETLALVEAYKEKWFALQRKNLKASDWDVVCAAVSSASEPETTKSSVQCRHKIEKLRQRYRAEKQRCVKNAGRFFSTWDLFPVLDSMNFASASVNASVDQNQNFNHKVGGVHSKPKNHGNSGSNLGFDHGFNGGYGSNFDLDHKFGSGYGVKLQGNRDFLAEGIKKFKSNGFGSTVDYDYDSDLEEDVDEEMGFQAKVSSGWDSIPRGVRKQKCGRVDRSFDHGVDDYRGLNGFASNSRPSIGVKNGNGGVKRGVDLMEEMVSSIKFLAEGFVRMEKMKIEMMKDIEKTRMEMELKHSEMILESQEKIIDVFAKALLE